jgi:Carboxypeptidase regulatory-like domain
MVTKRLFNSFSMKHFAQSTIWLCLSCTLLIFYAGCAEKSRQTAERWPLEQLDEVIKWELSKDKESPQKDKVLVALYLDDNGRTKDSTQKAEYRCYNPEGGSYSGIKEISYGSPWTTWERLRTNQFKKKIVIDPGPPYKTITKLVTLIPGQVTNLGRIKLEKVRAWGTASVSGTVKTEDGVLLEGAKLSFEDNSVTTDSQGRYTVSELKLGDYDLQVSKKGYIPGKAKVSIRNMENRNIGKDITLSYPRKVSVRYMITPGSINDFSDSRSSDGTMTLLIDKGYLPISIRQIKNDDFRKFIDKMGLSFRINNGKLTLRNNYSSIFCELIPASPEKFEEITTVEPLDRILFEYSDMQEGDILLMDGGDRSDYKLKLLFEKITPVLP